MLTVGANGDLKLRETPILKSLLMEYLHVSWLKPEGSIKNDSCKFNYLCRGDDESFFQI
jgi:hypothetical protein